jgi:hypothetical protein
LRSSDVGSRLVGALSNEEDFIKEESFVSAMKKNFG